MAVGEEPMSFIIKTNNHNFTSLVVNYGAVCHMRHSYPKNKERKLFIHFNYQTVTEKNSINCLEIISLLSKNKLGGWLHTKIVSNTKVYKTNI